MHAYTIYAYTLYAGGGGGGGGGVGYRSKGQTAIYYMYFLLRVVYYTCIYTHLV